MCRFDPLSTERYMESSGGFLSRSKPSRGSSTWVNMRSIKRILAAAAAELRERRFKSSFFIVGAWEKTSAQTSDKNVTRSFPLKIGSFFPLRIHVISVGTDE